MAKYIKSIFTPEKRRTVEELSEETPTPTMDGRRTLSMSRSGRLKHTYKKRQQLSVDVYGEEDLKQAERPKAMEYYVNTTRPITQEEPKPSSDTISKDTTNETPFSDSTKSPEEEIDNAFEIIDKS